jgi:hypothetical protein
MSDRTHDSNSTAQTQDTADVGIAPGRASGASMVHAMLAGGQRDPRVVAGVMQSHPSAAAEIVMLLNQTLGNRFVQAVLSFLAPGTTGATTGAAGPMRVTAHGLHVRSSPDTASHDNIIGTLPFHQVVQPTGQHGEWVAIQHDTQPAFVFGHYLEPAAKQADDGQPAATPVATPTVEQAPVAPIAPAAPIAPTAPVIASAPAVPAPVAPTPAAPTPVAPTPVAPTPSPTPAEAKPVESTPPAQVIPVALPAPVAAPTSTTATPAAPTPVAAPTPAPTATPSNPTVANAVTAAGHIPGVTDAKPHVGDTALHTIVKPGDKLPSVYVSVPPGGVTGAVEVFLFLHGMYAHETPRKDMPIKDPNPEEAMNLAGAMAKTQRNLVTLAPIARMAGDYPQWKDLEANGDGYKRLIDGAIANLPPDAHSGPITVGSISIAGHSAGGQALGEASEQLGDAIHDMTMEDGGYGDNQKKHPGSHAWKDSHAKVVKWLLSGQTEKLLRVLLHGEDNHGEGHILDSNLNVDSLTEAAQKMGLANVKVSKEVLAKHDKRSVPTMYLDHRLHITGLPAARTVSVFNMPGSNHMAVRNLSTQVLIEESRDTEFATSGASEGEEVTAPKHHHKHGKAAHTEPKHASLPDPAPTAAVPTSTPTAAPVAPSHVEAASAAPPTVAAPAPAPAADHANKSAKHGKHKHGKHEEGPQPGDIVFADLTDLDSMVAEVHNPRVSEVAKAVQAVSDKSKELTTTSLDRHEIKGAGRVELVRMIKDTHAQIAGLTADVDAAKLAAIKSRMFRALQEVSPYHEQARNIDILENNAEMAARKKTGDKTRTCNITSLGMALEGLGRGPEAYTGSHDKIVAVARHFQVDGVNIAAHGDLQAAGGGGASYESLLALRMPDFLELAAIAHYMKGTDEASVLAAADKAWGDIKKIDQLAEIAQDFGVTAEVKYFAFDPSAKALGKHAKGTQEESGSKESGDLDDQSKDRRHKVDELIDLHNQVDLETDPAKKADLQKQYDHAKGKLGSAMTDKATGVELEKYKQAVIATIGAELAAGKAVETHVIQHFVRVRAIHDDHVVIDDPGRQARAHKNVRWDEARAEGLFAKRIVLS